MKKSEKYDIIYEKFSFFEKMKYTFNYFDYFYKIQEKYIYLFVASVLKKGFYWNKKFLKEFVGEAEICGLGLLTDESGMGWISKGKKLSGEIWKIKEKDLIDIKYFYGLCEQKEGEFKSKNNDVIKCIYFEIEDKYSKNKKEIENIEYTLDFQNKCYNPILHQVIIEEIYLDYTFDYNKNYNLFKR